MKNGTCTSAWYFSNGGVLNGVLAELETSRAGLEANGVLTIGEVGCAHTALNEEVDYLGPCVCARENFRTRAECEYLKFPTEKLVRRLSLRWPASSKPLLPNLLWNQLPSKQLSYCPFLHSRNLIANPK